MKAIGRSFARFLSLFGVSADGIPVDTWANGKLVDSALVSTPNLSLWFGRPAGPVGTRTVIAVAKCYDVSPRSVASCCNPHPRNATDIAAKLIAETSLGERQKCSDL